jgi:hypothetical protein
MNLSRLLVEASRAEGENEIATRLLASQHISSQAKNELGAPRPALMLRRLAI